MIYYRTVLQVAWEGIFKHHFDMCYDILYVSILFCTSCSFLINLSAPGKLIGLAYSVNSLMGMETTREEASRTVEYHGPAALFASQNACNSMLAKSASIYIIFFLQQRIVGSAHR